MKVTKTQRQVFFSPRVPKILLRNGIKHRQSPPECDKWIRVIKLLTFIFKATLFNRRIKLAMHVYKVLSKFGRNDLQDQKELVITDGKKSIQQLIASLCANVICLI